METADIVWGLNSYIFLFLGTEGGERQIFTVFSKDDDI